MTDKRFILYQIDVYKSTVMFQYKIATNIKSGEM